MHKIKLDAQKLRKQGYSYNLINEKLGIPKGTLSYWFRDKPFNPNQEVLERIKNGPGKSGIRRHNDRVKEIQKLKSIGIKEIGKLSQRDLWLLGLGNYIGEGAKTTEIIRISNSDPAIIRMSIKWLKDICKLTNENFAVRIHIYPDNEPDECLAFWRQVTGLGEKNFRKISLDIRKNKSLRRARKLPYGTAHITVISNGNPEKGVRLFRKLNGWIDGALNQV